MIFTGLSNNWALLQRVNAIEKYLSENPIVPYAKASVAGEGTDTFVFNKSQLSVANGAGLMVGDLIICPDVTLWQVISIADSGEVTARYLVNFKGEQGEQGERGETGAQGQAGESGTVLSTLDSISITKADGSNISKSEKGFQIQAMNGYLEFNGAEVSLNTTNGTLDIPIKATGGIVADVSEDGKFIELHAELYLHRIYIRQSGISAVRFELLTRSATELTYAGIASLINGKYNTATGYAGKDPSSATQFGNSVYCVNAINAVISAICQNGQSIELETANVTITDTVEEI